MSPSFLRLISWEWRRLRAERAGLVLLLIWCGLLAAAATLGAKQTRLQHAEIIAAQKADAEGWSRKRALLVEIEAGRAQPPAFGNPQSPTQSVMGAAGERPVVLVPPPLAPLAVGPGDLAPAVKRAGMITKLNQAPEDIENPANRLAGPLDLAFVVGALLPLFALALSFDVLARERDAGIARLLGSQPVSLGRIVAARLSLHFLLLWLPLTVAASAAIAVGTSGNVPAFHVACETACWLGLAALYLIFWQAVAAYVNFRPWPSATNALVLSAVWLAAVLVVPALVQAAIQAVVPPADRLGLILDLRATDTHLQKHAVEVRDAYYAEHPEQRPTVAMNEYDTYFVQNLFPRALASDAALAPTLADFSARRAQQANASRALAWLSPALAFRAATEQLAGVSTGQQSRLGAAAADFQRRSREAYGAKLASMQRLTLADYDQRPEAPAIQVSLCERLLLGAPAIVGLTLLSLATAAFACGQGSRNHLI